jgi:hypothetical protein
MRRTTSRQSRGTRPRPALAQTQRRRETYFDVFRKLPELFTLKERLPAPASPLTRVRSQRPSLVIPISPGSAQLSPRADEFPAWTRRLRSR